MKNIKITTALYIIIALVLITKVVIFRINSPVAFGEDKGLVGLIDFCIFVFCGIFIVIEKLSIDTFFEREDGIFAKLNPLYLIVIIHKFLSKILDK